MFLQVCTCKQPNTTAITNTAKTCFGNYVPLTGKIVAGEILVNPDTPLVDGNGNPVPGTDGPLGTNTLINPSSGITVDGVCIRSVLVRLF